MDDAELGDVPQEFDARRIFEESRDYRAPISPHHDQIRALSKIAMLLGPCFRQCTPETIAKEILARRYAATGRQTSMLARCLARSRPSHLRGIRKQSPRFGRFDRDSFSPFENRNLCSCYLEVAFRHMKGLRDNYDLRLKTTDNTHPEAATYLKGCAPAQTKGPLS
ncbi:hypothetical protein AcV7_003622 [Taiwanofungus camphoratus]|nr:hypothetical protein AcV7_003622 [Antrodia cinnamomea]